MNARTLRAQLFRGTPLKAAATRPYLDVFAEEVGIETQPVPGNVEAALQKDVSEESTGVH